MTKQDSGHEMSFLGASLNIREIARLAVVSGALAASGCTNPWMPVAGPESWDVRLQAQDTTGPAGRLPYALVNLSPQLMPVLAKSEPGFYGMFTDRRPPAQIRFGIGDTVSVTIFEAAAGGLFIPSEAGVRP